MKTKVIKTICSFVGIVAIFLALYFYLAMVLLPKDYNDSGAFKYFNAAAIKNEKKNSIDTMFFGNSDLYNGISPMNIYKNTGYTCYSMGAPKQSIKQIRRQIRRNLKNQDLKAIFIETDCFYYPNKFFAGSFVYDNAYLVSPFKYHSRWKELEAKDFYTIPNKAKGLNYFKGYVYEQENANFKRPDWFMNDDPKQVEKIHPSVKKDVAQIVAMCKKKNIQLVFFTLPSPSSWSNKKHNGVQNLANKHGIDYVDLNVERADFSLDYKNCFRDNGNHLNYRGAKICSEYMADYMKNNLDLPDRRQDPKYNDWNKCLELFEEYAKNNPVR